MLLSCLQYESEIEFENLFSICEMFKTDLLSHYILIMHLFLFCAEFLKTILDFHYSLIHEHFVTYAKGFLL